MIAAINPSKTLQKPLEAILKPSKGFSLSVAHQRARTQSRDSTLTACGRATLDGVKRHPHPRGCSSLELLPLAPPRIGNGAKPRIWVKGLVPCGVQGRSPLPCRAQVISNPLRYGVTRYTRCKHLVPLRLSCQDAPGLPYKLWQHVGCHC